jgi:hypothetical protein
VNLARYDGSQRSQAYCLPAFYNFIMSDYKVLKDEHWVHRSSDTGFRTIKCLKVSLYVFCQGRLNLK